jgi:hypothetical protein
MLLRKSNDPAAPHIIYSVMLRLSHKSDTPKPHALFNPLIVSLVAMSILFGFGLATLVFRLQNHASPEAVLPGLVLSFAGVCAQFAMLRYFIRHRTQPQE